MLDAILGAWIAIAISGPPLSEAERRDLAQSCSQAIAGRCEFSSGGEHDDADALAVVSLEQNLSSARVEVGTPSGTWKERELSFADGDARNERLRAIGLTIATLFGPPDAEKPPVVGPQNATEPPRANATLRGSSASATAPKAVSLRTDLGVSTGKALDTGPLRWGGFARGSAKLFGFILEPTLAAGYSVRAGSSGDLNVAFATFSAGAAGCYSPIPLLTLRMRAEAALERISVSQSGPADSGARLVPAARFGLDVILPARATFAGFVSADVWLFEGSTGIRAGTERLATVPARLLTASIGMQMLLE